MRMTTSDRPSTPALAALGASFVAAALAITWVNLPAAPPTDSAPAAAAPSGTPAMPARSGMPGMTGMPMAAATGTSATDAPVATNSVAILNFAYSPATITVTAGTTVTWTNQDQDPHTVTSTNGGPLNSPALSNGQTFRYTFATPGHYDYLCTIHPFMTATVVVTP